MLVIVFKGIAMLFLVHEVRCRDLWELSDLATLGPLVATLLCLGPIASGLRVTKSLSSLGLGI